MESGQAAGLGGQPKYEGVALTTRRSPRDGRLYMTGIEIETPESPLRLYNAPLYLVNVHTRSVVFRRLDISDPSWKK